MKLYDYYRSTASYRVRIALNVKQINYDAVAVRLTPDSNAQRHPDYLALNPQGLVPTLDENGHILSQSLAIIEYLDEINPQPPLLPKAPLARARVRQLALLVACDMHPLNNLRCLNYLRQEFSASNDQVTGWYHHWLKAGFHAFEQYLTLWPHDKGVCYGHDISLADICLIPQVYNAKRFGFSLSNYPKINDINDYCLSLPAFKLAAPVDPNSNA